MWALWIPRIVAFLGRHAIPLLILSACIVVLAFVYQRGVIAERNDQLHQQVTAAEKEREALLKAIEEERARSSNAVARYTAELEALRRRASTTTREVIREVEKPVYRDCTLPPDGVRLLNEARRGPTATPSGTPSGVPADPDAP